MFESKARIENKSYEKRFPVQESFDWKIIYNCGNYESIHTVFLTSNIQENCDLKSKDLLKRPFLHLLFYSVRFIFVFIFVFLWVIFVFICKLRAQIILSKWIEWSCNKNLICCIFKTDASTISMSQVRVVRSHNYCVTSDNIGSYAFIYKITCYLILRIWCL